MQNWDSFWGPFLDVYTKFTSKWRTSQTSIGQEFSNTRTAIGQQMVHTPGSHLLTTNQTQIISKTRTHRSQQSILLQLFFATQCYTSGSEIWDLHAKLGLFWDQIWTLVPFGTKSQIWDFIIVPGLGILLQRGNAAILGNRVPNFLQTEVDGLE